MIRILALALVLAAAAVPVRAQVGNFSRVTVGACVISVGSGTPESAVTGSVCDIFVRTDTGQIYTKQSGTATTTGWELQASGSSSGTVTSVGLSLPGLFTVSGTPVTTAGTISASLATQSANTVLAGPSSGAATTPAFRQIVFGDWASNSCGINQIPKFNGSAWGCADDAGASSAQFLTLATDGGLANERVLTAGSGISLTDAGAGSTATLAVTSAATSVLSTFVGDSGAGGTKGLVPAPGAGDTAAGKFLKADGTFAVPSGTGAPTGASYVTLGTDATLTSERVLTGTANQITVTDGGAGSTVTLSTPQNLHTGATPQFARVGFGAAADSSAVGKFAGQYWSVLVDDGNSGTSDTIDWDAGNEHLSTLTGNVTYTFSNPKDGGRYVLVLLQDGTGSRTVTWPAAVAWSGGTAPTLTTTAGKVDLCTFLYISSTAKYYGACTLNY